MAKQQNTTVADVAESGKPIKVTRMSVPSILVQMVMDDFYTDPTLILISWASWRSVTRRSSKILTSIC